MSGFFNNNIEDFIVSYGIDEKISSKDNYELYKKTTDNPYTRIMFSRYLKEFKGYEVIRVMRLGTRHSFYKKINGLPHLLPPEI